MKHQETSCHILIVEDSFGIAQALQRSLSMYRDGIYRVEACSTGEAALKRLHETAFDLLITDLRLPGFDGLSLIQRARQIRPGLRSLLITAYGSPEVEDQARRQADAYLPKPFRLVELLHLVESILSQPERELASEISVNKEAHARVTPLPEMLGQISGLVKRKTAHLVLLACDLDGTLAENGKVAPETWEALRAARLGGLALVLVTGRTLDSFIPDFPCSEICEAIVAENGAVLFYPRRDSLSLPFGQLDTKLINRIESLGIPLERGIAIAATRVPHDKAVLNMLRESRSSATVEYNHEALMLLPPGATKASGLAIMLQETGYSPHNIVACGDAENDRSLFEIAELSAAVANAHPGLKAMADTVLPLPDGAGVCILIQDLLAGKIPSRSPRAGRELLLGHRMSGVPLHLDSFALVENNLGIFGSSGSGKSWLAGLLAEELQKQKYQLCIIDPEGDYRSLGTSPHTLVLGGASKQLPEVSDVESMLEDNLLNLVLDLSSYKLEQRIEYVSALMQALRSLRLRRGRPHYFLVDEIQHFCPYEGSHLTDQFLEAMQMGGFCVVSFQPRQISPSLLGVLDHFLITAFKLSAQLDALRPYLQHYPGSEGIFDNASSLPKGQAHLFLDLKKIGSTQDQAVTRFRAGHRLVPHIRHLHKYLLAPLPEWKRFYFHEPDGRYPLRSAASLWEFSEKLREVSTVSLEYHLRRGDFQSWLREVLHDEELAHRVNRIGELKQEGEALRQVLLDVIIERYEELDALI
jgi:hydroxymethylpyrimidine pyrophosphatase-like HAD family hydrolase/DNA-binding response OmpR family regulator